MGFKHLTWDDRVRIESLLKVKTPVKTIAEILGKSRQTIYNEIRRGQTLQKKGFYDGYRYERLYRFETVYSADVAQQKYVSFLREKGADLKLGSDYEFADFVERMICDKGYSPAAVLGKIKHDGLCFKTSVCVSTLYSYIYKRVFGRLSKDDLYFKGKRHKTSRFKPSLRCRDCKGLSIEKRPDFINDRSEFGHWEMDCVCGSSRSCLLTLCERLTRKVFIFKLPSQTTDSVVSVLNRLERRFGRRFSSVFKSITVDNGSEFMDFEGMSRSIYSKRRCRTIFYFCHPYRSTERASNERLNREIRRKIPRGSDIACLSDSFVSDVEEWVNSYPRSIFGFSSSEEMFLSELSGV